MKLSWKRKKERRRKKRQKSGSKGTNIYTGLAKSRNEITKKRECQKNEKQITK